MKPGRKNVEGNAYLAGAGHQAQVGDLPGVCHYLHSVSIIRQQPDRTLKSLKFTHTFAIIDFM